MIIESLELNNFGTYKGEQNFNLSVKNPSKPIILVGALNGSGKTTFLNSIQLCLYGNRAPEVKSSKLPYIKFLENKINKKVDKKTGASIKIDLCIDSEAKSEKLTIERKWFENHNGNIKEILSVFKDGKKDDAVLNTWNEYIENLLPLSTMPLFFFDGEKIEDLANPLKSSDIIRSAINGLLGLDIIDQCKVNLDLFTSRKAKELANEKALNDIEEKEEGIKNLESEIGALNSDFDLIENDINEALIKLDENRDLYRKKGGELFEAEEKLKKQKTEAEILKGTEINSLHEIMSVSAPLLLVKDMLNEIVDLGGQKLEQKSNLQAAGILKDFKNKIKKNEDMKSLGQDKNEIVEKIFDKEISDLESFKASNEEFEIDNFSVEYLKDFLDNQYEELLKRNKNSSKSLDKSTNKILVIDKNIAAIPSEDSIRMYKDKIDELNSKIGALEYQRETKVDEINEKEKDLDHLYISLKGDIDELINNKKAENDYGRYAHFSEKAKNTLDLFKSAIIDRKSEQIENEILQCFDSLVRKDKLITRISLDKDNFNLSLFDENNFEILYHDLSSGERQLLAVSILWALSRVSNQKLPVIIDTPLGRLDSQNRYNLSSNYFHKASHQIILLSTDEEMVDEYYSIIEPAITRTFRVDYDKNKGGSSIKEGFYFNGPRLVQ